MPEIKNSFTQGKMNKDLDERLIPNGQYRDAMNVEVSTSEGSDVGTVQNIKGNTSASDAGGFDNTCRCVGSIADEKTNKLYWFVHCDTRDAIIEYNSATGESFYILVDMFFLDPVNYGEGSPYPDVRQFLKFTGKQITGINIIDDFLFWTDGDNEPKKVNIKKAKAKRINSNHEFSFQHHSVTHSAAPNKVAYMQEEDLAVVKRKPLHAPLVTMRSSLSDPQESIFKKIFPRFCYRYKYDDGEYSAFSPFTDVVFKPGYSIIEGEYTEAGSPNYYDASTAYSTKEPYNTAMLNYVRAVDISGFNRPDTPTDVVQVDILYKQENSNVIYSIASIHRSDPEWDLEGNIALSELGLDNYTGYYKSIRGRYTIETENIHAALPESQLLRPWDNVPKKALAQDVSGNRIVYGNYTQGYDVYNTPTTLTQIRTRRDDQDTGIIRSLKSQREYQVGILFGDKYGRETPIFAGDGQSLNWNGYYYNDFDRIEYHLAASTPTALESRITSAVPDWADYFKFYIKQTSGEYYNLVMDRAYLPHQTTEVSPGYDEHLWLSFSSQDRNKISEEDYIIMKRSLEYSDQQISQPNRYKILDIKNEAPDAISYKFYSMGTYANNSDGVIKGADGIFTANPAHATAPQNQRIDREVDVIHINRTNWVTELSDVSPLGDGAELINTASTQSPSDEVKDLYMSWSVRGVNSLRYKITSVRLESEKYIIKLAKVITAEDAELARIAGTNPQSNLDHDVIFRIERREKWANENFSGKFFVKIATNDLVFEYVAGETFDITGESNVVANAKTFFWADKPVTIGEQEVDGIVNSESYGSIVDGYYGGDSETPNSIHGIGNITNTAAAWQALLLDSGDDAAGIVGAGVTNGTWGAIIDAMYFAGGNAGADEFNGLNSFAKESGQTMLGNSTLEYPIQSWGYRQSSVESAMGQQYSDYGFRISGQSETTGGGFNVDGNLAQAAIQYIGTTDAENRAVAVNGLEGIVNASGPHVAGSADGYRRFVNGSLYDPVARVNRIYEGTPSNNHTYINPNTPSGTAFVHLSFPECGVDLHDGIFPSDMAIFGLNGIAAHLQAIWGGGCFSNFDGTKLGTSGRQFVNMEDHVVIQDLTNGVNFGATPTFQVGEAAPTAPGPGVGLTWNQLILQANVGFLSSPNHYWQNQGFSSSSICTKALGYNDEGSNANGNSYKQVHERQWDPSYGPYGATKVERNKFINRLKLGEKFRFTNDSNSQVYKITNVQKRHLYNHTPWRATYKWSGSQWEFKGDSVEEAVIAWANTANDDGIPTTSVSGENTQEFLDMAQKIRDFGRADNRRVCYILEVDVDPATTDYNPVIGGDTTASGDSLPDVDNFSNIEFITPNAQVLTNEVTRNPVIWETEASQGDNLDIYYEASNAIPTKITSKTNELFMPRGSRVVFPGLTYAHSGNAVSSSADVYLNDFGALPTIFSLRQEDGAERGVNYRIPWVHGQSAPTGDTTIDYMGQDVRFYRKDGSYTTGVIAEVFEPDDYYVNGDGSGANGYRLTFRIEENIDASKNTGLSWYNCFNHGNGLESNRIRDDFNEMTITNGARVSATIEEPYAEEQRKSGMIYSGIYNSNSGVNNLNQFIMADKITKDLNPTYGSIQKLFSRSTDLVALCEDRVIKILANKDAVFNADGNPQLIASANVLGQATPFVGDYGISKNPESFASESYRAYFTDSSRGAVLRLSMDGLTPISDAGMRDYFRDNLGDEYAMYLGSYDNYKKQYNLTIKNRKNDNVIQNSFIDTGVELLSEVTGVDIALNGEINNGADYTPVTYGETDWWDDMPYSIDQASFNHTTTIRNHPAIEVGDAQAYYEGVTGVSFEDSVWEATSTQLEFRIFGDSLTAAGSVGQNPFDGWTAAAPTPGTGSGRPRAFIERRLYLTDSQSPTSSAAYFQYGGNENVPYDLGDGYPSDSTTPNSTNVGPWYDHTMFPPGHDGVTLVSQIDYPSIYLENGDSVATPTGYDRTTAWQGVTFRNLNAHPTDGNASALIKAPRAWTDPNSTNIDFDADAEVPQAVKDEYPSATNNTIFNGEEIRVKLAVALNNYSPTHKVNVRIKLFDGNSSISDSLVHIPSGGSLPYGDTATDTGLAINDENSWIRGFQDNAYVNWPILGNALTTGGYQHSCYFKFTDGTSNEGVVVDNLRVHVYAMVTEDDTATTSGYEKSELVVREIIMDKRYRLNTPEVDEVTAEAALANVPAVRVPEWAEVIHNNPDGWTANAGVNPVYGSEQIYGLANPGSIVTEDSISYYSGTNNALTVYNQYPGSTTGSITGTTNTQNYEEATEQAYWDSSDVLFSHIYNDAGGTTTSTINTDISDNPLVADNWYLVDVYYDPNDSENTDLNFLYISGVLGNSVAIEAALQAGSDHNDNDPNYPDYHFGQVVGDHTNPTGVKSLRLYPVVRTEYGTSDLNMMRGIFQYKAKEDGTLYEPNDFTISGWGADMIIKSAYLIDITQQPTMTEPTDWNTPDNNYVGPHAFSKFIHENTVYRSGPDVYYKNGMLCWNTNLYTYQYWNQNASSYIPHEPSNDGYKFAFTVAQAPDPNDPNGGNLPMAGNLRARVTNSNGDYGNTFAGFTMHNIIVPGDYIVLGNFNADEPTILQQPVGSNMVVNSVESSPITSAASTGHADKITFSVGNGYIDELGFTGAVHSVSLTDATNYFTGGTVDSWNFSGFDTTVEDWIAWDSANQRIAFNDAPGWGGNQTIDGVTTAIQANQRVYQPLDIDAQVGNYYRIKFDYNLTSGSLWAYYYLSNMRGFAIEDLTGSGTYDAVHQINEFAQFKTAGDESSGTWRLLNALVFATASHSAYSEGPTNGFIDNIVMERVVSPSVDITTVSFSEDVNGWASFKSFVPESGVSLNSQYYTMKNGGLWQHYSNDIRNSFYGIVNESKPSSVNVILNQSPSVVKSFNTLNYEGSQGRVVQGKTVNGVTDLAIYNSQAKNGWSVEEITTDLQKGSINEFIKKEGKWFNYIKGKSSTVTTSEQVGNFSFQGLGIVNQTFATKADFEAAQLV